MKEELITLLPNLRRFAFSLTRSRADADDLLQTTVERLLSRGVPDDAHLTKWAFRVCRNAWIDETRYRKIRFAPDDQNENTDLNRVDGEHEVLDKIALSEVGRALQTLPVSQREALTLVAIEGFSYAEVSAVLDVPIGTIMSRVARARKGLASQFNIKDVLDS